MLFPHKELSHGFFLVIAVIYQALYKFQAVYKLVLYYFYTIYPPPHHRKEEESSYFTGEGSTITDGEARIPTKRLVIS